MAQDISIHAPVKGATKTEYEICRIIQISIHAPVKGATAESEAATGTAAQISIHAPVKGATQRLRDSK